MTKNKKVFKAVATVTIFSVFTRGLSFLFKIYLSRALGAEVVGLYQICISMFYMFACFSASGVPLVLSRRTAESRALDKKEENSLFSSALLVGVSISIAVFIVLTLARPLLPKILADKNAAPMIVIMLPAIISTTIYNIVRGWFWGRKQFTSFSITETVEEVFRILFSIFFVSGIISGIRGAYGIALAFMVSDALVAILLLILFFCKGGRLEKPTKIKEIFLPSLPITAIRLFGSLVTTFIAIMLPVRLISAGFSVAEATASFGRIAGMANPMILAPNAIISSLAIVLIPEMSENKVKSDFLSLNRNLNNGISFSLLISGAFLFFYFALGPQITRFLFDDVISGKLLRAGSFVMLPMCVSALTQSALNSMGYELKAFVNFMVGTLLMVAGVFFLPKYMGIYSVALATFLSSMCTATLNLISLKKYTNFNIRFAKTLVLVLLFMLPCGYFAYNIYGILSRLLADFALLLVVPLGFLMYVCLCSFTELIDIKGFIKTRLASKSLAINT